MRLNYLMNDLMYVLCKREVSFSLPLFHSSSSFSPFPLLSLFSFLFLSHSIFLASSLLVRQFSPVHAEPPTMMTSFLLS